VPTELHLYTFAKIQPGGLEGKLLQGKGYCVYQRDLVYNIFHVFNYPNTLQHEVLVVGEIIKVFFSVYMLSFSLPEGQTLNNHVRYLVRKSDKMFVLAAIYGAMNILSYISLRNIGAGMFTIFAQCKILTTATFSAVLLRRQYSWARWRALFGLSFGVLLFSEPIWSDVEKMKVQEGGSAFLGTAAVMIEVVLSGFASIYFEKVIKTDPEQLGIWDRNFQLALASLPIYFMFMAYEGGGELGHGGGWSPIAWSLALLGAAGGLLVALSIKYGDSILKTLATTGAIVLSAGLDHIFMGGPLNAIMMIAGANVVIAICNYTFDTTPVVEDKALVQQVVEMNKVEESEKEQKQQLLPK
jgi:solute carrier family 35 (UDP-sugar transporter), member A1/2/3